jgi:hypothetical protein
MIEEIELLETFGKEAEGHYSDRSNFTIKTSLRIPGKFDLFHFEEVYGGLYFIKTLKDMDDLKNVYKAITNNDLV